MRINDAGLDIIKKFEGFRSQVYRCDAGVPTIGYGGTRYSDGTPVRMGDRGITEEEAEDLLAAHCHHAEYWVSRLTKVALSSNQFSSLVSFVFNIGSGNYQGSQVRIKLNRGSYDDAADNFWHHNMI